MRYATIPIWTYGLLMGLGALFVAIGAVEYAFGTPPGVAAVLPVVGLAMFGFTLRALLARRDDDRLRKTGTPATATVVKVDGTGTTINNVPQRVLHLRIDGSGSPYETTLKVLTFGPPSDGDSLGVRVDPRDRRRVVLSGDPPAATVPAAAAGANAAFVASTGMTQQVQAAVEAALRQVSAGDGAVWTNVPGGAPTATTTVTTASAEQLSAGDKVNLLVDLENMKANGSLSAVEFERLKRQLLGESP